MKIYRFFANREVIIDGVTVRFKAGSERSQEHAEEVLKAKEEKYRRFLRGEEKKAPPCFFPWNTPGRNTDYETPIAEELCETLDGHNAVTRNRYGAKVLNTEELLFLDIDDAPMSFREWAGRLIGRPAPDVKERIFRRIEELAGKPEFEGIGFRVYETCRGVRLLLSMNAKSFLRSPEMVPLFRRFGADPLYRDLCIRQNCCRARLTPKPARIGMKTLLKFRFPYGEEEKEAIRDWLADYEKKSADFAVCRLKARFGKRFTSPAIEFHDRITGAETHLPLA